METFMWFVFAIICLAIVILTIIQYAFRGERCEMCGEIMDEYYDEEKQRFFYECHKCGHKEIFDAKRG